MPERSLKRQLRVLTVPVFIEMALVMLLGAIDTVMLSRYSDNMRILAARMMRFISRPMRW